MSLIIGNTEPVHIINVKNVAPGANKSFLSLFNDTGSNREFRVIRAIAWNNQISPSAGGEIEVLYQRIVAQTGGTSVLIIGADANNAPQPAQVTAKTDATITLDNAGSGNLYFSHSLSTDDTRGIGNSAGTTNVLINLLANPLNYLAQIGQPITLGPSTGLTISQGSETVTAGKISAQIIIASRMIIEGGSP